MAAFPPRRGQPTGCNFIRASAFADAAALAPYLARLGISHVYASPYLKARPGSTHGYDIVDHGQLNPELGDDRRFPRNGRRVPPARAQSGAGLRAEPHGRRRRPTICGGWMCWSGAKTPTTQAGSISIGIPDQRYLSGKLLVPFLGDQYGAVLESGQLDCASIRRTAASPSGPTIRTSCRSARCIMPACWATTIRSWNGWATRSPACRTGARVPAARS